MSKVIKLSEKDMSRIQNHRNKKVLAGALLDKAIAEAKVADLEYTNVIHKVYLENGLDIKCKVGEDGTVSWPGEDGKEEAADNIEKSED